MTRCRGLRRPTPSRSLSLSPSASPSASPSLFLSLSPVILFCVIGCRPERNWEHDETPVELEVPAHVEAYLGVELVAPSAKMVELGRHLFHDPMLSADGSMSCATCHRQADGFADPRARSVGVHGDVGDRNAMAIVNLGFDSRFFWDGRESSLIAQAHDPVVNPVEMAGDWSTVEEKLRASERYPQLFYEAFGNLDIDSLQAVEAIAAFETTMLSFNSPYDDYFYNGNADALSESALRGFDLYFGEAECIHCHAGPLLTDQTFKNNGVDAFIDDPGLGAVTGSDEDLGKFKVPTLRNIAQTAPYMHDGRFEDLMAVMDHYDSGVDSLTPNLDPDMHVYAEGLNLSEQDKLDLVEFLKSFTDEGFLTDPDLANPF